MSLLLGLVHLPAALVADDNLLGTHFVLCQVFHLDGVEAAQTAMDGEIGEVEAANLHHLHQFTAEVQTCGGSRHSTLMAGEDGLEVLHVIRLGGTVINDVAGQRCRTEAEQLALELLMVAVVEEAQGAASAGRVVDDLGHHRAFVLEEQLVANANLAGRLHQHVPKAQLLVQLTQQEHLNLGIRLLLGTIETSREHLRVVEYESVALVEIVHQVAERQELVGVVAVSVLPEHLNALALAVYDHQSRLVAAIDSLHRAVFVLERAVRRVKGYLLFRQSEFEL